MANFSNQDVMKLRETTGVGMMDCKKALIATDGNFEEAIKYLREKGMASAAKKADRVAAEGLVACHVSADKKVGVVVEVNCETDFVARSDQFVAFLNKVVEQVVASSATDVETLLKEKCVSDKSKTLNDLVAETVATIGEKISVRRFAKFALKANGVVDSYIHMGGKIGVLVELKSDAKDTNTLVELAHNLAMQVAAAKPAVVNVKDVDPQALAQEREILSVQAKNEGKPAAIIDKMVEGRIQKYYKEVCLLEQEYVRDSSLSIKQVVAQVEKQLGAKIEVVRFARFEMGEGIEKRVDNFVDEIAQQLNNLK